MADVITQEFEVYAKYWDMADKGAISTAITAVLVERGIMVDNVTITTNSNPQRTTIKITNPSKLEPLDHDIIRNKVIELRVK